MTPNEPQVSIIIPTYNSAPFLAETLESVFAQTYRNYEIILVDDGSTDNTRDLVSTYGDRIRYLHQDNSGGPARPRNVAIEHARGKYICVFDSDDLMLPDKLERSVEFLSRYPDLGLIFTNFIKFDTAGLMPGTNLDTYANFWKVPKVRLGPNEYRIAAAVAFDSLFYGNYIGTSSVIIPAVVLKDIGPFDEEVTLGGLEDRDMWFRITRKYDLGFLNFIGHKYRVRAASVSKRAMNSAEARVKVIRRYAEYGLRDATRRQASALVAENLVAIGNQHQLSGDLGTARRYFCKSLAQSPSRAAVRGVFLTLLGSRGLALLRHLRRQVTQWCHPELR